MTCRFAVFAGDWLQCVCGCAQLHNDCGDQAHNATDSLTQLVWGARKRAFVHTGDVDCVCVYVCVCLRASVRSEGLLEIGISLSRE
jgi:hypothetical protein